VTSVLHRIDPWVGCVVACETGIARVLTDRGEVRASYSGSMLGRIARDRQCLAQPGDWVVLRRWRDDRVTIEDVWEREPRCADVIELRSS
jgi:hypothetical protein